MTHPYSGEFLAVPVEDLIRSAAGQLSLEMRDTPVEGERMLGVELQEAASATLAGYREAAVQVPEVSPIDVEAFQNLRDSSYAPLRKRFCEFLRAARHGEGLFRSAPVPPQEGNAPIERIHLRIRTQGMQCRGLRPTARRQWVLRTAR